MDLKGLPKRIIIAVIVCAIAVFLFGKIVAAFLPGVFTPAQINLIDICIWIAGAVYVVFGNKLFTNNP